VRADARFVIFAVIDDGMSLPRIEHDQHDTTHHR